MDVQQNDSKGLLANLQGLLGRTADLVPEKPTEGPAMVSETIVPTEGTGNERTTGGRTDISGYAGSDRPISRSVDVPGGEPEGGPTPVNDTSVSTMDMLRRYVELETLRRKHEADLKEAKSELELLQRQLLQVFEQNGIQNMKVNGMTVFLYRQLWAGIAKQGQEATVEERTTACNALKQANLGIYVYEQFNSQSISAYVREAVKNGDELPECFVMLERGRNVGPEHFGKIAVTEKYELRTRKS